MHGFENYVAFLHCTQDGEESALTWCTIRTKFAKGSLSPTHVPPMAGVDIERVDKKAKGAIDLLASKNAASEILQGIGQNFARPWG